MHEGCPAGALDICSAVQLVYVLHCETLEDVTSHAAELQLLLQLTGQGPWSSPAALLLHLLPVHSHQHQQQNSSIVWIVFCCLSSLA
jgi:hypothetical protein